MTYNFQKRDGPRYFCEMSGELVETNTDETQIEFFDLVYDNWMNSKNIAKKIVDKLSSLYELKNEDAIGQYLFYNRYLLPVLEDCYHKLKEYFTNNESLVLELVQDPTDNIERLVMYIVTLLPPKEAITVLRKIYREWWIGYPSDYRDHIVIDVEST